MNIDGRDDNIVRDGNPLVRWEPANVVGPVIEARYRLTVTVRSEQSLTRDEAKMLIEDPARPDAPIGGVRIDTMKEI